MARLVYGVGINDADYQVNERVVVGYTEDGRPIKKSMGKCPYYSKWHSMLERGYSEKYKIKFPTYFECCVCDDWLYFSKFKAWMETQDWQGKQLDKDLLVHGNKEYNPETCIFIDALVNYFLIDCLGGRGEYPLGVTLDKRCGKYRARCAQLNNKSKGLGYYNTPEEAHEAWRVEKNRLAQLLAEGQTDDRVKDALKKRFEFQDWLYSD